MCHEKFSIREWIKKQDKLNAAYHVWRSNMDIDFKMLKDKVDQLDLPIVPTHQEIPDNDTNAKFWYDKATEYKRLYDHVAKSWNTQNDALKNSIEDQIKLEHQIDYLCKTQEKHNSQTAELKHLCHEKIAYINELETMDVAKNKYIENLKHEIGLADARYVNQSQRIGELGVALDTLSQENAMLRSKLEEYMTVKPEDFAIARNPNECSKCKGYGKTVELIGDKGVGQYSCIFKTCMKCNAPSRPIVFPKANRCCTNFPHVGDCDEYQKTSG